MKYILIIVICLIETILNCNAKGYEEIKFGVYPIHLYDFNLDNNTFKVTFYTWSLSQSGYDANKNCEVANAVEYKIEFHEMDKVKKFDRSNTRFTATVIKNWDLTYFPFDRQFLEVVIEDTLHEEDKIKFLPDLQNSRVDNSFSILGWTLESFTLVTDTHLYNSNFGDPTIKNSKYSQLKIQFNIKREGIQLFFSKFMGFFVAFLLCIICYFSPIDNLNFRGSLMLGAVFATVGNKYVVDQAIPPYTKSILIETIQYSTVVVIIYTLFIVIITYKLERNGNNKSAYILNSISNIFCISLYVIFVGLFTYKAVLS